MFDVENAVYPMLVCHVCATHVLHVHVQPSIPLPSRRRRGPGRGPRDRSPAPLPAPGGAPPRARARARLSVGSGRRVTFPCSVFARGMAHAHAPDAVPRRGRAYRAWHRRFANRSGSTQRKSQR